MAPTVDAGGVAGTNILVDALRKVPPARGFLLSLRRSGPIHTSIVSATELTAGCRDGAELHMLREFLRHFSLLPIDGPSSELAYQWMDRFYLSHGLQIPDALIAATAMGEGRPLYTVNVRHFGMITGLEVRKPY